MTDEPRLVPAFWIWVALTLLVVASGPLLRHHRASNQDFASIDMTAK
jgi:hypothetical protein